MFGLSEISWLQFLTFSIGSVLAYNAAIFLYFKFLAGMSDDESNDYVEGKFADDDLSND